VGGQTGRMYTGRSVVVDPLGATLAGLGDEEGVAVADVTRERLRSARARLPVLVQRKAVQSAAAGKYRTDA
ncbi:MAG TPA: nitrilase-related carbon-nitrogen hydrolase, partial [Candidatus Dormibacteraeota bacterium]|nr:nitrilase-related carbon-nitrogen hydrolase [Candidatus Dormibacteraeota bacterium]